METSGFNCKILILINKLCTFTVSGTFQVFNINLSLVRKLLEATNLPNDVYFLLTMIAFSCALYNIITGRHFVKYWVPGQGFIQALLLTPVLDKNIQFL